MKILVFTVCLMIFSVTVAAQNWPSFRGENAAGSAAGESLPLKWDVEQGSNVRWKQAVPGQGHSSPIVWQDRVFVTSAVIKDGGSASVASGGQQEREWWLFAHDKNDGSLIWKRMATSAVPRAAHHRKANQCNSTPATNGSVIAAIMGSQGLYCFDMNGSLLWERDLGLLDPGLASDPSSQWGYGSSPIIYDDKVFVQCDKHSNSYVAAYDVKTGAEVWRQRRDELPAWSSPMVMTVNGKKQLVTNGGNAVRGYDLQSGELQWYFPDTAQVKVPTPIALDGQIIVTGGYPRGRPFVSIPANASGKITRRQLNWVLDKGGPYTVTPLAYQGLLYSSSDSGIFSCIDGQSGELLYRHRLEDNFSASPVAAYGKIYLAGENGSIQVIRAGKDFQILAMNQLPAGCFATPAISDNMLIIRSVDTLYAIGADDQ